MSYELPRPIFETAFFDLGASQGLGVNLPGRKRFAVRLKSDASAEGIVAALRTLIDWIESPPKPD